MTEISSEELVTYLRGQIAALLKTDVAEIDPYVEFINFGIDSIHALFLVDGIEKKFKTEVNPLLFYECPTIQLLSERLVAQQKEKG